MTTVFDFKAKDITGKQQDLAQYKGKTLLIVNTASKCGFTPQYEGLQKLYDEYHEKGLEVLGFPCNQFGSQEPDVESDIASFCDLTYGVNFPMFAKVDVNGDNAAPLFQHLKAAAPGLLGSEGVKWNFTKFLVSPDGTVNRFAPQDAPASLAKDIEKVLG